MINRGISQSDNYERSLCSLDGLSVGDAFGDRFFAHPDVVEGLIEARALPPSPWHFTDNTMMALSITSVLLQRQCIEQDILAQSFAEYYDPDRGYGPAMHRLLIQIREGEDWKDIASNQFCGQGSYGNGAAMRVAP